METVEAPLGPAIHTKDGRVTYPFQEQKERLGKQHFDAIVVLGEGPIKDVLFPDELTPEQQQEWTVFTAHPREELEPKFRVVSREHHAQDKNKRNSIGPLAKRRWGKENALAGGLALYLGLTDKLILTGGKTGGEDKPAESELIQDIIIRNFGQLFYKRDTGQDVDPNNKEPYEAYIEKQLKPKLLLEKDATNTLGNVALSAQKYPDLFSSTSKLGLITSGHHLQRGELLIKRLTGVQEVTPLSAQAILEQQGQIRNKKALQTIMQTFQLGEGYAKATDNRDYRNKLGKENKDLTSKVQGEEKWTDFLEDLEDPNKLVYWIGFAYSLPPQIMQNVVAELGSNDKRTEAARKAFAVADLDFDEYKNADLVQVAASQPEKYHNLQAGLQKLTAREIRDAGVNAVLNYK